MELSKVKDTLSYDQRNKDVIKKRMLDRRHIIQNSDKYIDARRPILIEALNSGQQKTIAYKTFQNIQLQ